MEFIFNNYAYTLIISGAITGILSFSIYQRGGKTLQWFSWLMGSSSLWSFFYGLELASPSFKQAYTFILLEYIGIASVPVFWFIFCLSFCSKGELFKHKINLFLLLILPIVTILLVWTNQYHHLYYKSILMTTDGPFPIISLKPGIFYQFFTIYFYCLMGIGLFFLFKKLKNSDKVYYPQNISIILAALIPWIANFGYLMGFKILKHIDTTPFAFLITSAIILLSIFYFKLFDVIPIAREKILDMINEGYIVLDNQLVIVDYNQAIFNFLPPKYNKHLIGLPINKLFNKYDNLIKNLKENIEGKLELRDTLNNEERYYEAYILIDQEEKTQSKHYILRFYDETENRKDSLEATERAVKLEKLNQLKNKMFSIIAHDLRGPLINLSAVLKMSVENEIDNEEFETLAPILSKDVNYTNSLLDNLLQWSKSQFKDFEPQRDFFNLHNLALKEIEQQQRIAVQKNIKITYQLNPFDAVYTDAIMLQTVIRNIIANAIKFCHENGQIHLSTLQIEQDWLIMKITDNGIGMSAATVENLFGDEAQTTTRGTQDEKGTGLGMLICKEFMRKVGGNILVESEQGKGTTFHLWIPSKDMKIYSVV